MAPALPHTASKRSGHSVCFQGSTVTTASEQPSQAKPSPCLSPGVSWGLCSWLPRICPSPAQGCRPGSLPCFPPSSVLSFASERNPAGFGKLGRPTGPFPGALCFPLTVERFLEGCSGHPEGLPSSFELSPASYPQDSFPPAHRPWPTGTELLPVRPRQQGCPGRPAPFPSNSADGRS